VLLYILGLGDAASPIKNTPSPKSSNCILIRAVCCSHVSPLFSDFIIFKDVPYDESSSPSPAYHTPLFAQTIPYTERI